MITKYSYTYTDDDTKAETTVVFTTEWGMRSFLMKRLNKCLAAEPKGTEERVAFWKGFGVAYAEEEEPVVEEPVADTAAEAEA